MHLLETLGRIRLTDADGREVDRLLQQPNRLALLAYLAAPAPGTWHRRDVLLAGTTTNRRTAAGTTKPNDRGDVLILGISTREGGAARDWRSRAHDGDRPRAGCEPTVSAGIGVADPYK